MVFMSGRWLSSFDLKLVPTVDSDGHRKKQRAVKSRSGGEATSTESDRQPTGARV